MPTVTVDDAVRAAIGLPRALVNAVADAGLVVDSVGVVAAHHRY